jgi:hypothetical protein
LSINQAKQSQLKSLFITSFQPTKYPQSFNMFSTKKLATSAFFSLTSLVSALPGTPAGYGTTTTKSTWTTSKTTTTPTTSCSTFVTTEYSTGVTTVTTYKDVTTWVPTTYESDVPKTYTTKSCSKETGSKVETRPVTAPYTDVSTDYHTSLSTKSITVTKGSMKHLPCQLFTFCSHANTCLPETAKPTVITTTVLVDDVSVEVSTVTASVPYVTTKTGVSTGYTTITKPNHGQTCAEVTKTKTDHSSIVTSTPSVTSSLCSETKPYTTDIVKTESKCTTIGGPGGYGW